MRQGVGRRPLGPLKGTGGARYLEHSFFYLVLVRQEACSSVFLHQNVPPTSPGPQSDGSSASQSDHVRKIFSLYKLAVSGDLV